MQLWRFGRIALVPALLLGVPLGLAAARRPRLAQPLFAVLNLIQTVPSIALFGLLIAPLAWLGQAWPGWGLQGIGLLPAAIECVGNATRNGHTTQPSQQLIGALSHVQDDR